MSQKDPEGFVNRCGNVMIRVVTAAFPSRSAGDEISKILSETSNRILDQLEANEQQMYKKQPKPLH